MTYHRPLSITTASAFLLIPALAFALDFSGTHLPYSDVPPGSAEAAAISLLTHEGVVQGNPDGTFRPQRGLNRAEFLKIVIESHAESVPSDADADDCFPDVPQDEWFALYVCHAKENGIVDGYPDGLFRPANPVNYAEALKILVALYGYALDTQDGDEWYMPYHRAAEERGTALPDAVAFGAQLTRGQMARLAAAFLSESRGLLGEYRAAEQGMTQPEEEEPEEQNDDDMEEEGEEDIPLPPPAEDDDELPPPETFPLLPSHSSLLLLGRNSKPLADGIIQSQGHGAEIRFAQVELFQPVLSVDTLDLLTADGTLIANLRPVFINANETYERYYEAQLPAGAGYLLAADEPLHVYVRARVRQPGNRAVAREILQVNRIVIQSFVTDTNATQNHLLTGPFPRHQTSLGRISSVRANGMVSAPLSAGTNAEVGSFSFTAESIAGSSVSLESLTFTLSSSNVTASNWRLSDPSSPFPHPCIVTGPLIECISLPESFRALSAEPRTFTLHADISLPAGSAPSFLQVSLKENGLAQQAGSVRWSDGTGSYRWVEHVEPIATGTLFTR